MSAFMAEKLMGRMKLVDHEKTSRRRSTWVPPVPVWKPSIVQPLDRVVERLRYYTDGLQDFAIFAHGTYVLLPDGCSDAKAVSHAKDALHQVFHAHPDMQPGEMDDGNVAVRYSHHAGNVVLTDIFLENFAEIDEHHQQALAADEVLTTPLGTNVFDEFGKKALFGRCFMFMDAQDPQVVKIERKIV
jgi:hypothetical protein